MVAFNFGYFVRLEDSRGVRLGPEGLGWTLQGGQPSQRLEIAPPHIFFKILTDNFIRSKNLSKIISSSLELNQRVAAKAVNG